MSLDLFHIMQGLDIQADDLSKNTNILIGNGLPGGDGGEQDAAPIGSIFMRTDSETDGLQLYWKFTTTNNSSADWKQATDRSYVDAVASGISWREPARVRDNTSYPSSASFPVTGIVDGVTLNPGDRVLFTNVAVADENNVWIWDGTSWTEDSNQESPGDAVLIIEGSSGDQQFTYDGSQWVLFGSSAGSAELGYIRNFTGKTGPGSELPTYSSTNVVTQASPLETAIGELDAVMGTGTITNSGSNYTLNSNMIWGSGGTLDLTSAINQLNDGIGDATFTSSGTNITDGDSVYTSINNLNEAIIPIQNQGLVIKGTQPAGILTTMDTVPVADATAVKWQVQVRATSTPANRRAVEIHAMTDGTSVDHAEYAVLKLGAAIPGLDFNVAVSGTDLVLTVNSSVGVDYVVKRIAYSAF